MTRTPNEPTNAAPDLIAWYVPKRENVPWTRIGAAWAHRDGKGYNLQLHMLTILDGRIVLRANEPKPQTEGGA